MYVPRGRVSDANALLRDEFGKSGNIKSRVTRLSVQSAIKSAQEKLKVAPECSFVVFVGDTDDGWISEILECPKDIHSIIYRCGSHFDTIPYENMIERGSVYAILCLDLSDAILAMINGMSVDIVFTDSSQVPSKMSRGGQSAQRFEQNRSLEIKRWFKTIADKTNELLLDGNVEFIVISGPGLTKNDFIKGEYLHHEVRKKVLGSVDVSYVGERGIKETLSDEIFNEVEISKQRKLVEEFFEALVNNKGIYGKTQIIFSINIGRIKKCLVTKDDPEVKKMCEEFGSEYNVVSNEFEEGKQIEKVFGGYAAIMRY